MKTNTRPGKYLEAIAATVVFHDETRVKFASAVKFVVLGGFLGAQVSASSRIARICGCHVAVFLREKVFSRFYTCCFSRIPPASVSVTCTYKRCDCKNKTRILRRRWRSLDSVLAAIITAESFGWIFALNSQKSVVFLLSHLCFCFELSLRLQPLSVLGKFKSVLQE